MRSKIIVDRKPFLNEFLTSPLKVFKFLSHAMNINTKNSNSNWSQQPRYYFRNFQ